MLKRIKDWFTLQYYTPKPWVDIEYFDSKWEKRIAQMASFITPESSIMDLGCGTMLLKLYLKENSYYPVDYKKRDEKTIICDFNKHEFPALTADVAFISGCLEYIIDYKWFIKEVCAHSEKVILSYCTTNEFPTIIERINNNWCNHLSNEEIINLFERHNFILHSSAYAPNKDQIFIFMKS